MDIEQKRVDGAISGFHSSSATWPAPAARPVLPVYSVEARLRGRRLRAFAVRALLFAIDAATINLAFFAAYYVRFVVFHGVAIVSGFSDASFVDFATLQVVATVGVLLAFAMRGLYRVRPASEWFRQFWVVASATVAAFAVFSAFDYLARGTDLALNAESRSLVMFTCVAIIVLVSASRLVIGGVLRALYRRGVGLNNLLVVGSSRLGKLMMQQIAASPGLGYRVVGFIHDLDGPPADFGRFKVLGTMPDLDGVIRSNHVAEVIIALPSHQHRQILQTAKICERAGADFKLVPDLYEMSLSRINVDAIEGVPLLGLRRDLINSWQYRVKRLIDIALAGAVVVLGAPIWLLIALAIKLDSPGPVLFGQTRVGYRGEPFSFLKFRSMRVNASRLDTRLQAQSDERTLLKQRTDPRVTRVGRLLRRTSLDEIPQMINILRGQMSLVGPRPLRPYEILDFEDWEKGRFEMKPGLTGLWQVRGRSDIKFDERILMDLYYIENWNLRLDLQIMVQTIPAVLLGRGAY